MRFLILLLFFACNVSAQPLAVTNTFSNNTVADAEDINQNFTDIVNGVNDKLRTDDDNPYNTAFGFDALSNISGGYTNTAIGFRALESETIGGDNIAVGASALRSASGSYQNVAVGNRSLFVNTVGFNNVAVGASTLRNNIGGENNTALGLNAMFTNTSGNINTGIGMSALYSNRTGDGNTGVGYLALGTNSAGSYNTAIGYYADVATWSPAISNATAIGYGAVAPTSNTVQIGNNDITDVYLGRRSAPGEDQASADLRLYGISYAAAHVDSSDGRLKENITPVSEGLSLINDLNPVSYRRIGEANDAKEMGFVAQEVQAALNQHGLHSGMVLQPDEDGYLYLRYNDLLAPMIKAIQELDDASEAKDAEIASLKQQLQSQQEELLAIVQSQQQQIAQLKRMVEHQFAMN